MPHSARAFPFWAASFSASEEDFVVEDASYFVKLLQANTIQVHPGNFWLC